MVRLTTDYGALRGRGALSLHDGRLAALNLSLPAAHLSGPRGEGDLGGAQILARAVATAQNGEQLHIQAHLNGDRARFGGASPVETADAAADAALDDFSMSLDLLAPYRKSKAFFDASSGAAEARIALHAAHAVLNGADIGRVDAGLALAGALQSGEKAGGFNGAAQLDAQAQTVTAGDLQATQARLHGDKLALKVAFAAGAAPTLIVNGPMGGGAARLNAGSGAQGLDARDVALDLGRVLLAGYTPEQLDAYFRHIQIRRHSQYALATEAELRGAIAAAARDGYAIIDQELQEGYRSIAVPIRSRSGPVQVALNSSAHSSRASRDDLLTRFLPLLQEAASRISHAI